MTGRYGAIAFSPPVAARQKAAGSFHAYAGQAGPSNDALPQPLDARVRTLIEKCDSFFMGTVTPTGWPYLQHRGGPSGFVHVLDATRIAFADYAGNQQFVSIGNLDAHDEVALFFIDYPTRTRVKVYGRGRVTERTDDADLLDRLLRVDGRRLNVDSDRAIVVTVEAWDVNCRRNITPRYTEEYVQERVRLGREDLLAQNAELLRRIAELEGARSS